MEMFNNLEKKIADSISTLFGYAKDIESNVIHEFKTVEDIIQEDVKITFNKVRQDALKANDEIDRLKEELQAALTKARDLHQAAVDAADAAVAAAQADIVRFKRMASDHASDSLTQASQITAVSSAENTSAIIGRFT